MCAALRLFSFLPYHQCFLLFNVVDMLITVWIYNVSITLIMPMAQRHQLEHDIGYYLIDQAHWQNNIDMLPRTALSHCLMLTVMTPTPRPPTHHYMPASVLYLSKAIGIINGYSFSHSLAAARAILYHLSCSKDTEDNPGRLHPMYIALHHTVGSIDEQFARKRLLQDILADVLDAVRELFHVEYLKLMELSDCSSQLPRWRDIIFCSMSRLLYPIQFCCAGDHNQHVHQPARSRAIIFCLMSRLLYPIQFCCAGDHNQHVHQPTRSRAERWWYCNPEESSHAYPTIW
jgi:hypothetical protein